MFKKWIALLLCITMLSGILPVSVLAEAPVMAEELEQIAVEMAEEPAPEAVEMMAEEAAAEAPEEPAIPVEAPQEVAQAEEAVIEPTAEPAPEPTEEPAVETEPTAEPTEEPAVETEPTAEPTEEPAVETEPTAEPTEEPAVETEPTAEPTAEPTPEPTQQPAVTIVGFASVSPVTVVMGDNFGLPGEVTAKLSDETEAQITVLDWQCDGVSAVDLLVGQHVLVPVLETEYLVEAGLPVLDFTIKSIFDLDVLENTELRDITPVYNDIVVEEGGTESGAEYEAFTVTAPTGQLTYSFYDCKFGPVSVENDYSYSTSLSNSILAITDAKDQILAVSKSNSSIWAYKDNDNGKFYIQSTPSIYTVAAMPDGVYNLRLYNINDMSTSNGQHVGFVCFTSAPVLSGGDVPALDREPVKGDMIPVRVYLYNCGMEAENYTVSAYDANGSKVAVSRGGKVERLSVSYGCLRYVEVFYDVEVLDGFETGEEYTWKITPESGTIYKNTWEESAYVSGQLTIKSVELLDADTSKFRIVFANPGKLDGHIIRIENRNGDLIHEQAVVLDENGAMDVQILFNGRVMPIGENTTSERITVNLHTKYDLTYASNYKELDLPVQSGGSGYADCYPRSLYAAKGQTISFTIVGTNNVKMQNLMGKPVTLNVHSKRYSSDGDYIYEEQKPATIAASAMKSYVNEDGEIIVEAKVDYTIDFAVSAGDTISFTWTGIGRGFDITVLEKGAVSVLEVEDGELEYSTITQNLGAMDVRVWASGGASQLKMLIVDMNGATKASGTATGVKDGKYTSGMRYDFSIPLNSLTSGNEYQVLLESGGKRVLCSPYQQEERTWTYLGDYQLQTNRIYTRTSQLLAGTNKLTLYAYDCQNTTRADFEALEIYLTNARAQRVDLTIQDFRKVRYGYIDFDVVSQSALQPGEYELYINGSRRNSVSVYGSMVPYLGSVNENDGVHNFYCYNLDPDAVFTAGLIKDGETKETKVDLLSFFDDSNCNLYFEADFYRTVRTGTYTVNLYQNGELFGFANGVMIKCTSDPYVKLDGNAASGMSDTNSVQLDINLGWYEEVRCATSLEELEETDYETDISIFEWFYLGRELGERKIYAQFRDEQTGEESEVITLSVYRYERFDTVQMKVVSPTDVLLGDVYTFKVYVDQLAVGVICKILKNGSEYYNDMQLLYQGTTDEEGYEGWHVFSVTADADDYAFDGATGFRFIAHKPGYEYTKYCTQDVTVAVGKPTEILFTNLQEYSENYTTSNEVTIKGIATPNSTVTIKSGSTTLGTASVSANGSFTCTFELEEGSWYLTATDSAGLSTNWRDYTVTVDTTAPVVTEMTAVNSGTQNLAITWSVSDANPVRRVRLVRTEQGRETVIISETSTYSKNQIITAGQEIDNISFTLTAIDEAGNRSEPFTVRLGDKIPPTVPGTPGMVTHASRSVAIRWGESTDNFAVGGYRIYRDGEAVATVDYPAVTYTDTGLERETEYTYTVTAYDTWGNESEPSEALSVSTEDPGFSVLQEIPERVCVDYPADASVSMSASLRDNGNLEGAVVRFTLQRDGEDMRDLPCEENNGEYSYVWPVSALEEGDYTLCYRVTDRDGTEIVHEYPVELFYDEEAPTAPGDLGWTCRSSLTADLEWTASTDNVGVDHYEITVGEITCTVPGDETVCTVGPLDQENVNIVQVTAVDGRGNRSAPTGMELYTVLPQFASFATFDEAVFKDRDGGLLLDASMQDDGNVPGAKITIEYAGAGSDVFHAISTGDASFIKAVWDLSVVDYGDYVIRYTLADRDGTEAVQETPVSLIRDTIAPQITLTVGPEKGSSCGIVTYIDGSATDNVGLTSVDVQYSTISADGPYMNIEHFACEGESHSFNIEWQLGDLPTGSVWYRAQATDRFANVSSTEPVLFYNDSTPPPAPDGFAILCDDQHIELVWSNELPSEDFSHFRIFRKDPGAEDFACVEEHWTLAGYDNDLKQISSNVPYSYYVTSVDRVGNEGAPTGVVTGSIRQDVLPPVIDSTQPSANGHVRHTAAFSVRVTDDQVLGSITLSMAPAGTEDWTEIGSHTLPTRERSAVVRFDKDVSALAGAYVLRVHAKDVVGNEITALVPFIIDPYVQPVPPVGRADSAHKAVSLTWLCETPDITGYTILRADSAEGEFKAVHSTVDTAWTDKVPVGTYYYRIRVADRYGETALSDVIVGQSVIMDAEAPVPEMKLSNTFVGLGTAIRFDGSESTDNDAVVSYHWDFGNGDVSSDASGSYTYPEAGTYTVILVVKDECENEAQTTQEVRVIDPAVDPGYVNGIFRVVDSATGDNVPGASLTFTAGDGMELTGVSDEDGLCIQLMAEGEYTVKVQAKGGYQERTLRLKVEKGDSEKTIPITRTQLTVGELTWKEMTYDEIIAAGIDVSDPANQHVYKYQLVLEFGAEIEGFSLPINIFKNAFGEILGYGSVGGGVGSGGLMGGGGIRGTAGGRSFTVYPLSEKFFLVVWGSVSWLKEMFHVQLLVVNNSAVETIDPCVAELVLPEGLSLAAMNSGRQHAAQALDPVAPNQSTTVDWYVRGDKEGSYTISATLKGENRTADGVSSGFEYEFTAADPITVLAGKAMKLDIIVPDAAFHGEDYTMRFELTNTSDKTLYNVTHELEAVGQYQATAQGSYKKGEATSFDDYDVETLSYEKLGNNARIFVKEFKPGETLYLSLTTKINFYSELEGFLDRAGDVSMLSGIIGKVCPPFSALGTVCGLLSNLDVRYTLQSASVTTMEGSTTTIPTSVIIEHVPYPSIVEKALELLMEELIDTVVGEISDDLLGDLYEGYRDYGFDGIGGMSYDDLEKLKKRTDLIKSLTKGSLRYVGKQMMEDPDDLDFGDLFEDIDGKVMNVAKSSIGSIVTNNMGYDAAVTVKPLVSEILDEYEIINSSKDSKIEVWVENGTASYSDTADLEVEVDDIPTFYSLRSDAAKPSVHVRVNTDDAGARTENGHLFFTGSAADLEIEGAEPGSAWVFVRFGSGEDAITYYIPYLVQAPEEDDGGEATETVLSVDVPATLGGTIAEGVLNAALQEECLQADSGVVVLQMQDVDGAEGYALHIPRTFLRTFTSRSGAELMLRTSVGLIRFDRAALAAVYDQSPAEAGGMVTLCIRPARTDEMTITQEMAMEGAAVWYIGAFSGETNITRLGVGQASVAIPYRAGIVENPRVVRLEDDFYVVPEYEIHNDADDSMGVVTRSLGLFAVLPELGDPDDYTGNDMDMALSHSYIMLHAGQTFDLTADVNPEPYARGLKWRATSPEGGQTHVITVDDRGRVTAQAVGAAYVEAEITVGAQTVLQRCRVDVLSASGVTITEASVMNSSVPVDVFATDYATIDVLLAVEQNRLTATSYSLMTLRRGVQGNLLTSAAFASEKADELFELQVLDDRTLAVVPRFDPNDAAVLKTVPTSLKSAIVINANQQTLTTGVVTLKLTKKAPAVTLSAVKLNSYVYEDSVVLNPQCKTAEIASLELDYSAELPEAVRYYSDTRTLMLSDKTPVSGSLKVKLIAKLEGYCCEIPVTLSVSISRQKPVLKLKTSTITVYPDAELIEPVTLTITGGDMPPVLTASGDYELGHSDEPNSFTLGFRTTPKNGSVVNVIAHYGDGSPSYTLPVTVKTANAALKLSKTSATLNAAQEDLVRVNVTATPAGRKLDDAKITVMRGKEEVPSELDVTLENGVLTAAVNENTKVGTYTVNVSLSGEKDKAAKLTVKTVSKPDAQVAAKLTPAKASLASDGDRAELGISWTPGGYQLDPEKMIITVQDKNKADAADKILVEASQEALTVVTAPDVPAGTYKVSFTPEEGAKATVFNVTVNAKAPALTLTMKGKIDTLDPATSADATLKTANLSHKELSDVRFVITSGEEDMTHTFAIDGLTIRATEATDPTLKYKVQAMGETLGGETLVSKPVALSVTQKTITMKASRTAAALNPAVDDYVKITFKNTPDLLSGQQPLWTLTDKKTKQDASDKLDVAWLDGALTVSVNENTPYGAAYVLSVRATEGNKATNINLTTVAQSKTSVTMTLKKTGSLDLIRSGLNLTVTPTLKGCVTVPAIVPEAEVYTKAKIPVSCTENFVITPMEDGRLLIELADDAPAAGKYELRYTMLYQGEELCSAKLAFDVVMGKVKITPDPKSVTLFTDDRNTEAEVILTLGDDKIDGVERVEVAAGKTASPFRARLLADGTVAIGFAQGDTVPKSASMKLNVFCIGNTTEKPNLSLTIKVNVK